MKKLNHYIPCLVISVIMSLLIAAVSVLGFVSKTVFNSDLYIDAVETEKVSDKVMTSINKYFDDAYASSGIPAEVYTNAVDRDEVSRVINGKIKNTFAAIRSGEYDASEEKIDFTGLEKSINTFFDDFAAANNVEVNDAYKEQLDKTIKAAEAEIESQTDVFMTAYMKDAGILSKLTKVYDLLSPAMLAAAAALAVSAVILAVLNKKSISGLFYWLAVSCFSSSVLVCVPCLILKFSDYFKGLIISTEYIRAAVTSSLYDMADRMISVQSCIFAGAVVFAVIYVITGRRKKER